MIGLAFGDQRMQDIFNDPSTKFDVVIVINFFGDAAGYYIAQRFNASLVLYFTGQMSLPWIDEAVGQPHSIFAHSISAFHYRNDFHPKSNQHLCKFFLSSHYKRYFHIKKGL